MSSFLDKKYSYPSTSDSNEGVTRLHILSILRPATWDIKYSEIFLIAKFSVYSFNLIKHRQENFIYLIAWHFKAFHLNN